MIPIRQKPTITYDYKDHIRVIPNALDTTQIYRLREYAKSEQSGLHRRGSKDFLTKASFNTCQVYSTDDEIYTILNPLWKEFINVINDHADLFADALINIILKTKLYEELDYKIEYKNQDTIFNLWKEDLYNNWCNNNSFYYTKKFGKSSESEIMSACTVFNSSSTLAYNKNFQNLIIESCNSSDKILLTGEVISINDFNN